MSHLTRSACSWHSRSPIVANRPTYPSRPSAISLADTQHVPAEPQRPLQRQDLRFPCLRPVRPQSGQCLADLRVSRSSVVGMVKLAARAAQLPIIEGRPYGVHSMVRVKTSQAAKYRLSSHEWPPVSFDDRALAWSYAHKVGRPRWTNFSPYNPNLAARTTSLCRYSLLEVWVTDFVRALVTAPARKELSARYRSTVSAKGTMISDEKAARQAAMGT